MRRDCRRRSGTLNGIDAPSIARRAVYFLFHTLDKQSGSTFRTDGWLLTFSDRNRNTIIACQRCAGNLQRHVWMVMAKETSSTLFVSII